MHDAIWKQGDTCLSRLFNPLTQWYGLAEFLDGNNDNKDNSDGDKNEDNSVAATVVNINEDLFLTDETSIFSLSTNAINLFLPKYGQTIVAEMKFRMNLCFAVARNEVPVDIIIELHDA